MSFGIIAGAAATALGAGATTAAIVGAGASALGSGLLGSKSAGKAVDAQTQAAGQSDATQRYFYDTTRADNAPFRDTGLAANNRLAQLMGLSGGGGGGGLSRAGGQTPAMLRNELAKQFTTAGGRTEIRSPFVQGGSDSGNWGGEIIGYGEGAPMIDEAGLQAAIDQRMTQQATPQQQDSDPSFGSLSRNFSAADIAADPLMAQTNRNFSAADMVADPVMMADPSYMQPMRNFDQKALDDDLVYQNGLQFGLNEGTKGINRMAAAGGGALSDATLKALTRFGNDYGTTKTAGAYDRFTSSQNTKYAQRNDSRNRYVNDQDRNYGKLTDSFNRFNTNQDRTYNKLAGLSGAGMQATNQVSAAGQNAGNNISASQQGLGNAQGAASIAKGNAWQGAINGGVAAIRGSGYTNAMTPLFDDGYSRGTGSSYNGNYSRM